MTIPEQIEASKAKSIEKWRKIYETQKNKALHLKIGRRYVHDNRNKTYQYYAEWKSGYGLAVIATLDRYTDTHLTARIAYSIKIPNDEFSARIAKGQCGWRLFSANEEDGRFWLKDFVHKNIAKDPTQLCQAIIYRVLSQINLRAPGIRKETWMAMFGPPDIIDTFR